MKKIQLMFAAQQLSKEQMKNVSGGVPDCPIGSQQCQFWSTDFGEYVQGQCTEGDSSCVCVGIIYSGGNVYQEMGPSTDCSIV